MKATACRINPFAALLALILLIAGSAIADVGNYASDVDLKSIVKLIDAGKYASAIDRLHDELDLDPDNPDILSLLGFSYRKIHQFEDALAFYQWALKVEPEHKGANEYLGQLYLETDQLDKAVRQLEILDSICTFGCKEYTKLKQAIDSYQKSASNS